MSKQTANTIARAVARAEKWNGKASLALVKLAITILGGIDIATPRGDTRRVRKISAIDGWWETDNLTADMRGYIGYKKPAAKLAVTRAAVSQLRRAPELIARANAQANAFADR